MTDRDDEALLRQRLRAADPAASLPPAAPDRVARLLEDVMSTELTNESRETGTRNRGPLTWLVAAAAAVVIAGVGVFAVLHGDASTGSGAPSASGPTVTTLSAPGDAAYAARCAVPNATTLGQATVAFDGTVDTVADGQVHLQITHWYAGDTPTDVAEVQAPAAALERLVQAVHFREGQRYLVAASDGQVMVCGLTAPYSDDLAAVYDQAFS